MTRLLFGTSGSRSPVQGAWRVRCKPGYAVKLRNHPGLSYLGIRTWPPEWIAIPPNWNELPKGESGILKGVFVNDGPNPEIILRIEWEDNFYMGNIRFDDPWFCVQVYRLLQRHVECSIQEIGDLELP